MKSSKPVERLRDSCENDVGGVQARVAVQRNAAAAEQRLERHSADVRVLETELDRFPQVREIIRRHRHRERDREVHFRATFDGAPACFTQIGATKVMLAFELHAIELQIELEPAVIEAATQLVGKSGVVCDAHAICVQEQVIDSWVRAGPGEELEELRMQSRLAAGELEDFDAAFAIDYALNPALQIAERHRIDVLPGAHGRTRVARRAREVAGVDDFDERETGGKFFEWRVPFSGGVPAQRSAGGAVARPAGIAATIATVGVFRIALGEPVKSRVRADAGFRFAMN